MQQPSGELNFLEEALPADRGSDRSIHDLQGNLPPVTRPDGPPGPRSMRGEQQRGQFGRRPVERIEGGRARRGWRIPIWLSGHPAEDL